MMNLMLRHQSQPFPDCDGRAIRGRAFLLQPIRSQASNDRHRLAVQSVGEFQHVIASIRQFLCRNPKYLLGLLWHVFPEHMPIDCGDCGAPDRPAVKLSLRRTTIPAGPPESSGRLSWFDGGTLSK